VKHTIEIPTLNHGSAGHWRALIGCTGSPISAMPGVGAFAHPALPHGRKTWAAFWAGLDCETPPGTMGGHPGLESVIVVLVVPQERRQARNGGAALPASSPALVIQTARSSPNVSTKRWR
jgi:hypothetical protein